MTLSFRIVPIIFIALMLCGCGALRTKRVLVPQPYALPVRQYVEIPAELTKHCEIADGPLREVVNVAKQRKAALKKCNGQLDAIRELSDRAAATNEPAAPAPVADPPAPR